MRRVAIVDYGMGNLRSVVNAFNTIGVDAALINEPSALAGAGAIVLPGVGAFGEGIQRLRTSGFEPVLREQVLDRKMPFLGLCLGLQLLATTGLEHGRHAGLGWIAGTAVKIPTPAGGGLRLPHVGWNEVKTTPGATLFEGLGASETFYFVHSYVLVPEDSTVVTGVTSYGSDLVASLAWRNIHATQFHPEKSHAAGLRLLTNFARLACA